MVRHDRPAISAADRDVNRTMSRLLRNSLARSARRFDCERRFRDFAIADWARAIDERTASTCARCNPLVGSHGDRRIEGGATSVLC
jgi:hypothetical protein